MAKEYIRVWRKDADPTAFLFCNVGEEQLTTIANIKNPDKRAGPYRRFVGAAALGGPLASILKIAIERGRQEAVKSNRAAAPFAAALRVVLVTIRIIEQYFWLDKWALVV